MKIRSCFNSSYEMENDDAGWNNNEQNNDI